MVTYSQLFGFLMKEAVAHLRRADPILAAIIDRVGMFRMEYREPTFDTLVRSIIYQQLSGRVARVIYGRLSAALPGGISPEGVIRLRPERMRRLGLSGQKTLYIRELAKCSRRGRVCFEQLSELADEEVIVQLTQVKGIGVWTAQMFLMFALRRPDVLPSGDLGIRSAIRKAYGLEELPKPREIEEMARAWRPYCTAACWYLWRSLENEAAI
jgi:DNA-3-methyladenine glycosylase II